MEHSSNKLWYHLRADAVATEPQHRKLQELAVHLLGSLAVFLLLNEYSSGPTPLAVLRGRFVLGAGLPDFPALVATAFQTPWLGPGLVIGFVLLVTLRGTRRSATKPVHRSFRMPRLERYRGEVPRRHQDLEI